MINLNAGGTHLQRMPRTYGMSPMWGGYYRNKRSYYVGLQLCKTILEGSNGVTRYHLSRWGGYTTFVVAVKVGTTKKKKNICGMWHGQLEFGYYGEKETIIYLHQNGNQYPILLMTLHWKLRIGYIMAEQLITLRVLARLTHFTICIVN